MSNEEEKKGLPESFLAKLFDMTGSKEGGNKGYALFYIDENGNVDVSQKIEAGAIGMALQKSIELRAKAELAVIQDLSEE